MCTIGRHHPDCPRLGTRNTNHDLEKPHQHLLGIGIRVHAAGNFGQDFNHGQTVAGITRARWFRYTVQTAYWNGLDIHGLSSAIGQRERVKARNTLKNP
jgi:hypothetical protein